MRSRWTGTVLTTTLLAGCLVAAPTISLATTADPVPVSPEFSDVGLQPTTGSSGLGTLLRSQASPQVYAGSDAATGFAVAGITWSGAVDSVVAVELRTLSGDGWGAWEEIETEDADDNGYSGTVPVVVGDVDRVEARVTARLGASVTEPRLTVIDPGASAADAGGSLPAASAFASAGPAVLSRAAWGADESMMTWTPQQGRVQGAVIHHTAGSNDYASQDVPSIIRGIYAYHAQTRGWGDIGYNFLVDRFGRAWEGRAGGITSQTIGAHATGFNSVTTGVSMIGTFTSVDPPPAQLDTVTRLVAWKLTIHKVRPSDTMVVNGQRLPTIIGHRDVASTSCPGQRVYNQLASLRAGAVAWQGVYSDQWGTAQGNFVKKPDSSVIYLISAGVRHPVQDWDTLLAYGSLGAVSVVSSTYVDSLSEGPPLGRFARGSDGTVYFVDSSIKVKVPTCAMVAAYGSNCAASVLLTAEQLGLLQTASQAMTQGYVTSNGKLFYVENGTRREAFDSAAIQAAGISTGYVRLSESGIARLPYGTPILRPDVVIRSRTAGTTWFYTNGQLEPALGDTVDASILSRLASAYLDPASLVKIPAGPTLAGFVRPAAGNDRYVLSDGGLIALPAPVRPVDSQFTVWPDSLFAGLPKVSGRTTFVRSARDPAVRWLTASELRPVIAMQDLVDLSPPGALPVYRLPNDANAKLPTGRTVPSPGSLVKSATSADIYLVDGYARRVLVGSFTDTNALGLRGYTVVPQGTLDELTPAPAALSPLVICNGVPMVGYEGLTYLHDRRSATGPGLPVTTLTAQTCGRLPLRWSTQPAPLLIKAPDAATVYLVQAGRRSPVSSWAEAQKLAGRANPVIIVTSARTLALIPSR